MNFLLIHMGVISRSLGAIALFHPKTNSVPGCRITIQHKVRSIVPCPNSSSFDSEWAVREDSVQHLKPSLQPHQHRTRTPPSGRLGRL